MEKINRRGFFKATAKGLAATTAFSMVSNDAEAAIKKLKELPEAEVPASFPDFKFNADGKYKILQLADTHFVGMEAPQGSKRASMATKEYAAGAVRNITNMLEAEKPDLVIHTGDIIYSAPAKEHLQTILEPMAKLKIPFAVTLGNHDGEFDLKRQEVFDFVRTLPSNINTPSPKDVFGSSNNIITLSSKDGKVNRVFYLFDSGRHFSEKPNRSYEFLRPSQIAWYNKWSEYFQQMNAGSVVPATAFMHIPLREYNDGLRETKKILIGHIGEEPASSLYNSGLFAAAMARGDIDSYVFGHDHDNDATLMYAKKFLIYGRFSGYSSVYNNLKPAGVRIFEFTEGQSGFSSWIRLYDQKVIQKLSYPEDFKTDLF